MSREMLKILMADIQEELFILNHWLYEHPELGGEEFAAQKKITEILSSEGFSVKLGVAGLPTSFIATADLNGEGPAIGFLAEYDALPEIGHACGHNIIAASCVGAAIILKKHLSGQGGKIVVFGTPAEETVGGKIFMAESGVFEGIDIAMSVHPSHRTSVGGSSLASHPLEIHFKGKASHAAASPEDGINALDALVEMYTAVRMLKNHLRDDVRIPGVITQGGTAPNIVPERAVARFSIRAADSEYLEYVIRRVKQSAEGAAASVGAEVDFQHYEPLFEAMKNNQKLSELFANNLESLGYKPDFLPETHRGGSTDVGNVSQITPTIHPAIAICKGELAAHTREFAEATISETAKKALIAAALAMAFTVMDIRENAGLMAEIYKYHNK
jgi:amidohydrolase